MGWPPRPSPPSTSPSRAAWAAPGWPLRITAYPPWAMCCLPGIWHGSWGKPTGPAAFRCWPEAPPPTWCLGQRMCWPLWRGNTPASGHGNVAWERFTPAGPVALLPCDQRYAVVHTAPPQEAETLLALSDGAYLERLTEHFGGRVRFTAVSRRHRYPLGLRYRRDPVGARTVWLGNAAQTLHPVAGQGFNLALRDVWALAELLRRHGGDPGDAALLTRYGAERRLDRLGTIGFTNSLVRLFSNDNPLLRHARGTGLLALDLFPPLRHFLAKRMMFGARAWP